MTRHLTLKPGELSIIAHFVSFGWRAQFNLSVSSQFSRLTSRLFLSCCKCLEALIMYCLQWLIPVLLIPKPLNPALLYNHAMFMVFYLAGFFLERKPCTICSLVFLAAVFMICYSCVGNCIFWPCETECHGEACAIRHWWCLLLEFNWSRDDRILHYWNYRHD